MAGTLQEARAAYETANAAFEATLHAAFPGLERWHWFRALAHVKGEIGRRNDDTSQDAALAAHEGIRVAWDDAITKLHAFYALRDGPRGFLGSRGV